MTNTGMFFRMLFSAVFRRRSRAVMAVVASLVGAATLFCLAMICLAVPQQMNEEMRAYGANLIVTPTESTNADGKAGIDKAMVQHTTEMVKAKGSAKYATYRYENVRVNASPYVMAGVNAAQVKNLNHHWVVDGSWPTDGKVLVGRDIADAIGLRIGSAITIGYRASDNASTNGTSSNSSIDQQTKDGRVSSDIMDTSGTEFRVAGIVDTGGSEDSIIYATNADVNKLTGITRGVDVIEYSAGASDLAGLVSSINDMTSMHVKAQQVTKITASDTRIITMLQTLFWIVSLVVLVLTLVGVGTTISSIVSQRRNEIGLRPRCQLACHRHRVLHRIVALRPDWRPHRHRNRLRTRRLAVRGGVRTLHRIQLVAGPDFRAVQRAGRHRRLHPARPPRHPHRPRRRASRRIKKENRHAT